MANARLRILAVLPIVIVAGGCVPHVARPYPRPTPEELLAALHARNLAIHSLRARTKMDHFDQGAGERVKGDVLVLLQAPDELHFHAVSPMGTPLATLTSDGARFALFDAQKNRFLVGPAEPCNIGRLTGVAIDGASIATILFGGMPIVPYTSADETWDDRRGEEVLTLTTADGTVEVVHLGGPENAWNVTSGEVRDAGGRVLLTVTNEHFHEVSGVPLPGKTKITEPEQRADLIIDWQSVEVNPSLPARAFELQPPPGVVPEEVVGCDGATPSSAPASRP